MASDASRPSRIARGRNNRRLSRVTTNKRDSGQGSQCNDKEKLFHYESSLLISDNASLRSKECHRRGSNDRRMAHMGTARPEHLCGHRRHTVIPQSHAALSCWLCQRSESRQARSYRRGYCRAKMGLAGGAVRQRSAAHGSEGMPRIRQRDAQPLSEGDPSRARPAPRRVRRSDRLSPQVRDRAARPRADAAIATARKADTVY